MRVILWCSLIFNVILVDSRTIKGNPRSSQTTTETTSTRVSARKCNEYKDIPYDKLLITILFRTEIRIHPTCHFTTMSLILGGQIASIGEFPHMALIGYEDESQRTRWGCAGVLISEDFVLSAAHCIENVGYGEAKYVRLGENNLKREDDGSHIDVPISEWIAHPDYRHQAYYNDISLLRLNRTIELTPAIRPACLPEESISQPKVIATGWGKVGEKGDYSEDLRKVPLEISSHEKCYSDYRDDISYKLLSGIDEETQVCAGSPSNTTSMDTCRGDSGGPLQIYHPDHLCSYTIVGLASFGHPCGRKGVSDVYTRVYPFLDWIEENVWPNQ